MKNKVLNIFILLAINLCCAKSDIVSFVRGSASTVLDWYASYIKPLWTTTFIQSNVPPNQDVCFYGLTSESRDALLTDTNGEELFEREGNTASVDESDYENDDEGEDSEFYTYLSNYNQNFYDKLYFNNQSNKRGNSGIFYKFLNLFGYYLPNDQQEDQRTLRPHMISNKTTGLDVSLTLLFEKTSSQKIVDSTRQQIQLILPGTLWCGDGTLATSDNELGWFSETDGCCKDHDECATYIESGKTWMNLENNGIFTRSHCKCDRSFYKCLKKANSIISNRIGETYFNVLKPQCYSNEYPIVGCIKRRSDKRCFKYVIDDSSAKTWQWFDNKKY